MKKLVFSIFALISLVTTGIQVNAKVRLSEEEIKLYEEMCNLDPAFQEQVSRDAIVSIGKTSQAMEVSLPNKSEILREVTENNARILSEIPSSQMSLYVNVERLSGGKYKIYTLTKWEKYPIIRTKDRLAISWGGGHALLSDSMKIKYSDGVTVYDAGQLDSVDANKGLSRKFPVGRRVEEHDYSYSADTITFVAVIQTRTTGTSNAVAAYAHKTFGIGDLTVSFSGTKPSFGGFGVRYDSMFKYDAFNH